MIMCEILATLTSILSKLRCFGSVAPTIIHLISHCSDCGISKPLKFPVNFQSVAFEISLRINLALSKIE